MLKEIMLRDIIVESNSLKKEMQHSKWGNELPHKLFDSNQSQPFGYLNSLLDLSLPRQVEVMYFPCPKAKKFTLSDISVKLGLSKSTLSKILNQDGSKYYKSADYKIDHESIKPIAKAYEYSISKLFEKRKKDYLSNRKPILNKNEAIFKNFIQYEGVEISDAEIFKYELSYELIEKWIYNALNGIESIPVQDTRIFNLNIERSFKDSIIKNGNPKVHYSFWVRSHHYYIFTDEDDISKKAKNNSSFSDLSFSESWIRKEYYSNNINFLNHEFKRKPNTKYSTQQFIN